MISLSTRRERNWEGDLNLAAVVTCFSLPTTRSVPSIPFHYSIQEEEGRKKGLPSFFLIWSTRQTQQDQLLSSSLIPLFSLSLSFSQLASSRYLWLFWVQVERFLFPSTLLHHPTREREREKILTGSNILITLFSKLQDNSNHPLSFVLTSSPPPPLSLSFTCDFLRVDCIAIHAIFSRERMKERSFVTRVEGIRTLLYWARKEEKRVRIQFQDEVRPQSDPVSFLEQRTLVSPLSLSSHVLRDSHLHISLHFERKKPLIVEEMRNIQCNLWMFIKGEKESSAAFVFQILFRNSFRLPNVSS